MPTLPSTQVYLPVNGTCGAGYQETDAALGASVGKYPVKQRMPTQHGTFEPASKYFELSREEHAVSDDEFVEITGEGTPTSKSAFNKLFSDSVAGLAEPASH